VIGGGAPASLAKEGFYKQPKRYPVQLSILNEGIESNAEIQTVPNTSGLPSVHTVRHKAAVAHRHRPSLNSSTQFGGHRMKFGSRVVSQDVFDHHDIEDDRAFAKC